MGMLARTVGGGTRASVTELAPPDRDAHTLQVRPSMMQALRQADLVVVGGGGAGTGLAARPPPEAAGQSVGILPGGPRLFRGGDAQVSRGSTPTPTPTAVQGDVHPQGNPHVQLDPVRLARQRRLALANRLGKLDAANTTADFQARRPRLQAKSVGRSACRAGSRPRPRTAPACMLYHQDANYLLDALQPPARSATSNPCPASRPPPPTS
jgi:zinc/manganese transport system substrate-binding protein